MSVALQVVRSGDHRIVIPTFKKDSASSLQLKSETILCYSVTGIITNEVDVPTNIEDKVKNVFIETFVF